MSDFSFQDIFPLGEDATPYRLLTTDHVGKASFNGQTVTTVAPEALSLLARQAFADCVVPEIAKPLGVRARVEV